MELASDFADIVELKKSFALRKGFYFSFDAFLALAVMSASLLVVVQSSEISNDPFKSETVSYQKANLAGQDAMKLASRETFREFDSSFQQELVDETVMESPDLDRTILDGISLLWAARNFSYAEETAERYFDSRVPDEYEYRLQVTESGSSTNIYRTEEMPSSPDSVSSISRLVSGHKIDRPSEGFQARARATETEQNQTKIVNIPMMGSGGLNQRLFLEKDFQVNASEIHSATLFFAAHWGESNFQSNVVSVNGQELDVGGSNPGDWLYYADKNGTQLGFDRVDVTSEVKDGWNRFNLEFKNQNNHHVHIHPGTRIRVRYSTDNRLTSEDKRDYFTEVESETSNKNKRGGAWITKPFFIPEDADVHNVSLRVKAANLQDIDGRSDLQVYLNREKVYTENVSGDTTAQVQLKDDVENGTNVLSVYGNVKLFDGRINSSSFLAWKNGNPTIYSDPRNNPGESSSLYVNYSSSSTGLQFGKLRVVDSRTVGGEPANPKEFQDTVDEDIELLNYFVNLAQLDSRNVTLEAGQDSLETVFVSPREFATPSKIRVSPDRLEEGETNKFRLSDECSINCSVLPESSIEQHVLVPSQVGYGDLFENRSAAVDDARERLREALGRYADATSIDSDTLSTGNQPYLWGPASVKLVIWRD